jgi:hypothetical protein
VLAGAAAAGAEALDLAGFGRRDVVRTAAHLTDEALLLHLAPELPKGLLELLGILYDNSHNPTRIQGDGWGLFTSPPCGEVGAQRQVGVLNGPARTSAQP